MFIHYPDLIFGYRSCGQELDRYDPWLLTFTDRVANCPSYRPTPSRGGAIDVTVACFTFHIEFSRRKVKFKSILLFIIGKFLTPYAG